MSDISDIETLSPNLRWIFAPENANLSLWQAHQRLILFVGDTYHWKYTTSNTHLHAMIRTHFLILTWGFDESFNVEFEVMDFQWKLSLTQYYFCPSSLTPNKFRLWAFSSTLHQRERKHQERAGSSCYASIRSNYET